MRISDWSSDVCSSDLACLHVGSFKRVVDDVEQEAVTENFEIFPVAASAGLLGEIEITPAQCAGYGRGAGQGGAEVDPVGWVGRIGRGTDKRKQRRKPVHRHHRLLAYSARRKLPRVLTDRRYTKHAAEESA